MQTCLESSLKSLFPPCSHELLHLSDSAILLGLHAVILASHDSAQEERKTSCLQSCITNDNRTPMRTCSWRARSSSVSISTPGVGRVRGPSGQRQGPLYCVHKSRVLMHSESEDRQIEKYWRRCKADHICTADACGDISIQQNSCTLGILAGQTALLSVHICLISQ